MRWCGCPQGQAPRDSRLTVLAEDVAGLVGSTEIPLVTAVDTEPPIVSIVTPANGSSVVEDTVFEVLVSAQDNARLDLARAVGGRHVAPGAARGARSVREAPPYRFSLSLPLPASGYPVALSVVARDGAGGATASETAYVRVVPDVPPEVTFQSLASAVESFTRTELDSGYVVMLQGTPATLRMRLEDDAGLASVRVLFGDQVVKEESFPGAPLEPHPGRDVHPARGPGWSPRGAARVPHGHRGTHAADPAARRVPAPPAALAGPGRTHSWRHHRRGQHPAPLRCRGGGRHRRRPRAAVHQRPARAAPEHRTVDPVGPRCGDRGARHPRSRAPAAPWPPCLPRIRICSG